MRGLSLLAPSPSRYHPSAHRFTAERNSASRFLPHELHAPPSAASQRNSYIALSDAQAIRFLCPHAAPTSAQRLRNVKATLGLFPIANPLPQAYYSFLAGAKRPERANAGANPHVNIERRHVCARRFDSPILTETYISAAIWTGRTATARPSRSRRATTPRTRGIAQCWACHRIGRVSAVFRLRQRERPSHRRSELPRLRLLPRQCVPGNHGRGPVRVPLVGHLELRQR